MSDETKYWFIVEPKHNPALNLNLALSGFTGAFKSEVEAQEYLNKNRGKYSHRATVVGVSDFSE